MTPPHHNVPTRWNSALPMIEWFVAHQHVLSTYDRHFPKRAASCVPNPDGKKYLDVRLHAGDFDMLQHLVCVAHNPSNYEVEVGSL
jgi:hypothetical protein